MPGLIKIAKNYLSIDWIFKVGSLFQFSFEEIPFCCLSEKEETESLQ